MNIHRHYIQNQLSRINTYIHSSRHAYICFYTFIHTTIITYMVSQSKWMAAHVVRWWVWAPIGTTVECIWQCPSASPWPATLSACDEQSHPLACTPDSTLGVRGDSCLYHRNGEIVSPYIHTCMHAYINHSNWNKRTEYEHYFLQIYIHR